jgi:hypothetical protein
MIELSDDQRRALKDANGAAVRAVDPGTGEEYVLIKAELYERLNSVLTDDSDFARDVYPQIMEVFGREGWDDPSMDVYNDLDPRRQP